MESDRSEMKVPPTATPLHTGAPSPWCVLSAARVLRLSNIPTVMLDTANPISTNESTARLHAMFRLLHILSRPSFLKKLQLIRNFTSASFLTSSLIKLRLLAVLAKVCSCKLLVVGICCSLVSSVIMSSVRNWPSLSCTQTCEAVHHLPYHDKL